MKKISKLITLVLAVSLIFGAFGVSAQAEGTATVTVGTVNASAGDTVKVEVSISDCSGFSSYDINFTYDSEYVTAVEAKMGIKTMLYMPNLTVDGKKEVKVIGGDVNNVTENGVLATVTFKIADNVPGGTVEVPLKVTKCKLTEYNGQNDVEIKSQSIDGKLIIKGSGSSGNSGSQGGSGNSGSSGGAGGIGDVVWNSADGEIELTPATLTDGEAVDYNNPLSGGNITAGDYYVNEDKKIAIPAADVENGVKNDPDNWRIVGEDNPIDPSASSGEPAPSDEPQGSAGSGKSGSKLNWLLIGCIAGGAAVVIAGAIAFIAIMKKKNKTEQE
ncbi:MAG: hypothetical protein J5441_07135 [Clostridia bacterium]|nr:hypothetical protein [Clostridia bacterium]